MLCMMLPPVPRYKEIVSPSKNAGLKVKENLWNELRQLSLRKKDKDKDKDSFSGEMFLKRILNNQKRNKR